MFGAVREKSMDPDEVDRIIERRAKDKSPKDAANEREARWKASEREYHDEREEARRHQWITYYRTLSRSLRTRAADFDDRASQLAQEEA
jgi:hypothetical protein